MTTVIQRDGRLYQEIFPFVDDGWIKFHRSLVAEIIPDINSLSTLKALMLFMEQTTDFRSNDVPAELSIRLIAKKMKMSPTSAEKAVRELLDLGIIILARPGNYTSAAVYELNREFKLLKAVNYVPEAPSGVPTVDTPPSRSVPIGDTPDGESVSTVNTPPAGSVSTVDTLKPEKEVVVYQQLVQVREDDLKRKEDQERSSSSDAAAALNDDDDDDVKKSPPLQQSDLLKTILDWIGFDDALTATERKALDPPTVLAWAYQVKIMQANGTSRITNPLGLVRARWRKGELPRSDLLALARGWLALDNERRAQLREGVSFAARYAYEDTDLSVAFPRIPIAAATAVYRVTDGELAPPALSPAEPEVKHMPDPVAAVRPPAGSPESKLWCDVLGELEMQMARGTFVKWFQGTTAVETAEGLTVELKSEYALEWIRGRLGDLVQKTVDGIAGRPTQITFTVAPMIQKTLIDQGQMPEAA